MMKTYCIVCDKCRKFKNLKISYILKKTLGLSIVCSKCGYEYKKTFKEEESVEIFKNLGLTLERLRVILSPLVIFQKCVF